MSDPHPHANHHQHVAALDSQAQILDLDAEVMADHIAAVAAWLPVQAAPVEIVDLGAGTGAARSPSSPSFRRLTSPLSTPPLRTSTLCEPRRAPRI